jgi:hypothetical protein
MLLQQPAAGGVATALLLGCSARLQLQTVASTQAHYVLLLGTFLLLLGDQACGSCRWYGLHDWQHAACCIVLWRSRQRPVVRIHARARTAAVDHQYILGDSCTTLRAACC